MSIDWDKPLQMADGRDAVLLTKDYMYNGRPLCLVMSTESDGFSNVYRYDQDGNPRSVDCTYPRIRNKAQKFSRWVNIYNHYDHRKVGSFFTDEQEAVREGKRNPGYIKTIAVTWEEV